MGENKNAKIHTPITGYGGKAIIVDVACLLPGGI